MNKEAAGEIAALQHRLAGLQTEVERLEDVKAIKILQRAYGYYVDQASWDEVADLFTDDASVELAKGGVYQGKDRIREFFYKLGNDKTGLTEGQLNEHIQLQPVVHVSADGMTAKARWRALILAGQYGERAVWGEGPYENEYRKEDGIWKISKLHWYQTFIVPYAGGWGANTDVTGGDALGASAATTTGVAGARRQSRRGVTPGSRRGPESPIRLHFLAAPLQCADARNLEFAGAFYTPARENGVSPGRARKVSRRH